MGCYGPSADPHNGDARLFQERLRKMLYSAAVTAQGGSREMNYHTYISYILINGQV